VGGRQYVSVLVGYGSNTFGGDLLYAGWKFGAQPRRLLTFALDGKAKLPPSAPRDMQLHPADDPAYRIDEAQQAAGSKLFLMNCALCHGANALSAGSPGPDLRESQVALDREALWSVVHDGVLVKHGMPRFDALSRADVESIYAYIRSRARDALHGETPGPARASSGPS
jgi:quinohemoprotein ethanol dehydrogenase